MQREVKNSFWKICSRKRTWSDGEAGALASMRVIGGIQMQFSFLFQGTVFDVGTYSDLEGVLKRWESEEREAVDLHDMKGETKNELDNVNDLSRANKLEQRICEIDPVASEKQEITHPTQSLKVLTVENMEKRWSQTSAFLSAETLAGKDGSVWSLDNCEVRFLSFEYALYTSAVQFRLAVVYMPFSCCVFLLARLCCCTDDRTGISRTRNRYMEGVFELPESRRWWLWFTDLAAVPLRHPNVVCFSWLVACLLVSSQEALSSLQFGKMNRCQIA